MKNKNKKGFTLIEILAAVVILGILSTIAIVSVNRVIQNAKEKHYTTSEKNLKLAGQSYAQQNRNILPKVIGQKAKISMKKLVDSNYIKQIKDYNDNNCSLEKSYVQIYKYSQTDYSYMAYLDCPKYTSEESSNSLKPTVSITLSGDEENAKAKISVSDDNKLMSYSYIIYKGTKEVKNSGSVAIENYSTTQKKDINLSEYTPGTLKIVVTATNIYGNTTTKTASSNFKDTNKPNCIIDPADEQPKTWLNSGSRTITVGCDDGEGGSGCKQTEYTHTFSDSEKTGTITIEDEAGNEQKCNVSVYIDKTTPTIKVVAYKRSASGGKTGSAIGTVTANNSSPTSTLDLSKLNSTGWLNKANYPDGIYYEISYSDDLELSTYEEKQNDVNLKTSTTSASAVKNLIASATASSNKISRTMSTTQDGYRTYSLTAKDTAGNTSTVHIIAPLDREAPNLPTVGLYNWKTNNEADRPTSTTGLATLSNNTWSKLNIYTRASGASDAISGFKEYQYTTTGKTTNATNKVGTARSIEASGESQIKYRACDIAGNCSAYGTQYTIKLDKVKPTVPTSTIRINSSTGTTRANSSSWTKDTLWWGSFSTKEEHSGVDHYEYSSGCTESKSGNLNSSYTYNETRNSTFCIRAVDKVGNVSDWSSKYYFKIDKTKPQIVSASNDKKNTWTNSNVTISATSKDDHSGIKQIHYYYDNKTTELKHDWENDDKSSVSGLWKAERNNEVFVVAEDNVGNKSEPVSVGKVMIDKTGPSIPSSTIRLNSSTGTTRSNSSAWTKDTLWWGSFNATDSSSGVDHYEYSSGCTGSKTGTLNSSYTYGSTVNYTFCIRAVDKVGNAGSWSSKYYFKIDKKAPTCTSSGGSTSWKKANITLTGKCEDDHSGCKGDVTKTFTSNTNKTSQTPGTVYDNVGNSTACPANQTVKLDKTAPEISSITLKKNDSSGATYTANEWTTTPVYTKVNATDGYSGIKSYSHELTRTKGTTGGPWTGTENNRTVGPKTDGVYSIKYTVCDQAGNCTSKTQANIKIDRAAPTFSLVQTTTARTSGSSKTIFAQCLKVGEDLSLDKKNIQTDITADCPSQTTYKGYTMSYRYKYPNATTTAKNYGDWSSYAAGAYFGFFGAGGSQSPVCIQIRVKDRAGNVGSQTFKITKNSGTHKSTATKVDSCP